MSEVEHWFQQVVAAVECAGSEASVDREQHVERLEKIYCALLGSLPPGEAPALLPVPTIVLLSIPSPLCPNFSSSHHWDRSLQPGSALQPHVGDGIQQSQLCHLQRELWELPVSQGCLIYSALLV